MESEENTSRVRKTLEVEEEADHRAGSMLRMLRLANHLTVDRAAMRAGVSPEEWEDLESGVMAIPVTRVPSMASAIGMERADLFRLLTRIGSASLCS